MISLVQPAFTKCHKTIERQMAHRWPFFLWLYISYLVRNSSPHKQAKGLRPSACMMAVCVLKVAASRYIRRQIGQGRGS